MQNSKFKLKFGKYPFFIHANPLLEKTAFPTHSHGLNEKGWPEFIIDPLAFGPEGNGSRINAAYDYFKKSRRRKLLHRILQGHTVKIPINKLHKHWDTPPYYTLCFRLVPNTFEAVKLAYDPNGVGVDPDLVVVQIYVKGDDYVLEDAYYTGGVTW
ncbi:MAG: hypothetical protein ABIJ59_16410 [Pseudomonadota bacterium]